MCRKIALFLFSLFLVSALMTGCSEPTDRKDKSVTASKQADVIGIINDTLVDVFKEPDTTSERVTQAIFNQPVSILKEDGLWINVGVVDGYTGWIKARYIKKDSSSIQGSNKYRVLVTAKTKNVLATSKSNVILKDVVMGTEFYSNNKTNSGYEIALPENKTGWIEVSGTIQLPPDVAIPKTSAADFVATASKYKGAIYLWGGVSSWGVDSSGLTYISSRVNGVNLPRDADEQYQNGENVDLKAIKPGDLMFFSTNEDLKDISHVGICVEGNKFIHASQSKGSVIISLLSEDYYKRRLVGIKRIFNSVTPNK